MAQHMIRGVAQMDAEGTWGELAGPFHGEADATDWLKTIGCRELDRTIDHTVAFTSTGHGLYIMLRQAARRAA